MKFKINRFIKCFDAFLAVICAILLLLVAVGEYTLPDKMVQYENDGNKLSSLYSIGESEKTQAVDLQTSSPRESIKLLGVIPVKEVSITHKATPKVFVSGEAFGIKLYTDGVIVVSTQGVDIDGKTVDPAGDAGIKTGDIIISINNVNVYSSSDVVSILNDNNGLPYKVKLKRDGRFRNFVLTPVYSDREGCYKAGMWVRDSTAGIGTITFYNKDSGVFAALGHQINDVDTKEIMPLLEGEAVATEVRSVQKANSGSTGSLVCDFKDRVVGNLLLNTTTGVYGSYSAISDKTKEYPVASVQEIKKGSAQIVSTIDGDTPMAYDAVITKINYNSGGEKDIVIKITDENLISKTGGIVQGMSGSPIIQNGKIVGAVTHVIINNPEKGYGIFAQTMVEESDKIG